MPKTSFPSRSCLLGLAKLVHRHLAGSVSELQRLQDGSGAVVRDRARAREMVEQIVAGSTAVCDALDLGELSLAITDDLRAWGRRGCEGPPDARRIRDAYRSPKNGEVTFFAGPAIAQNGPGPRGFLIEYFLSLRDEPACLAALADRFPHPLNPCQSTRLLAGSSGFGRSNCIVFFPEYVAAEQAVEEQRYAVFFFNKFRRIYLAQTLPTVVATLGARDLLFHADRWRSAELKHERTYAWRCVWGYLHDYFHHQGPRPLDRFLTIKQDWFASVVEELKADCQTAVAVADARPDGWRELFQFVLFERMFRYPSQPDRETNFDAATGYLLFEYARTRGALEFSPGRPPRMHFERTVEALGAFAAEALAIEKLADAPYLRGCRELVRRYLDRDRDDQHGRTSMPEGYRANVIFAASTASHHLTQERQ